MIINPLFMSLETHATTGADIADNVHIAVFPLNNVHCTMYIFFFYSIPNQLKQIYRFPLDCITRPHHTEQNNGSMHACIVHTEYTTYLRTETEEAGRQP